MSTDIEQRVTTHIIDMVTCQKFKSSKKFKTWLHAHPNFIRSGKLYRHIYEADYLAWKAQQESPEIEASSTEITEDTNTNA